MAELDWEDVADDVDEGEDVDDVDDYDDEAFDAIYLKYEFDGIATLEGLATALRALAAECELKAAAGWALTAPIDGGWCHLLPAVR